MNTEERERVRLIQERYRSALSDDSLAEIVNPYRQGFAVAQSAAKRDIAFILSLLDSQAAFSGPCVGCGHNNYDAERGECKQRWMEGRMSVVCGCPCAKHNSLANAAAAMRDKCVEKVKERADAWRKERYMNDLERRRFNAYAEEADNIANALQSLPLEAAANSVPKDEGEGVEGDGKRL